MCSLRRVLLNWCPALFIQRDVFQVMNHTQVGPHSRGFNYPRMWDATTPLPCVAIIYLLAVAVVK